MNSRFVIVPVVKRLRMVTKGNHFDNAPLYQEVDAPQFRRLLPYAVELTTFSLIEGPSPAFRVQLAFPAEVKDIASLREEAFARTFGDRVLVQTVVHFDSVVPGSDAATAESIIGRRCFKAADVVGVKEFTKLVYEGLTRLLSAGADANELLLLQHLTANAVQGYSQILKWWLYYDGQSEAAPTIPDIEGDTWFDEEPL